MKEGEKDGEEENENKGGGGGGVVTAQLLQAGCCQYRGQVNRKREPPQHTTHQSI